MRYFALIFAASLLLVGCDECSSPESVDFESVDDWLTARVQPLGDDADLQGLVDEIDQRQLVLLGEATHGTREFYEWRADLSLATARQQGLDFVGIEADWLAARAADRYVMGEGDVDDIEQVLVENFQRWPLHWMWANEQFADFLTRVRAHNADNPDRPIRIYGIDMQGFFDSLERLVERVEDEFPDDAHTVVEPLECLRQFSPRPGRYTRHIQAGASDGCQSEVQRAVEATSRLYPGDDIHDLSARKHARVVDAGEAQYRERIQGGPNAHWNVRATHMFEITDALLDAHGDDARGVIWAHNTHIGDARATDMEAQGRVNIGQLARQHRGEESVFSLGFSTLDGEVIAARQQGESPQIMQIPRAVDGSVDEILSRPGTSPYYVLFSDADADLPAWNERPGHRAIGVTYHPRREHPGNYVRTNLAARYDGLVFIENTSPLHPL